MFGSLVRLAQAEVENTIGNAVDKVIVAVPFVVAIGFGAAALCLRLIDLYGAVSALLLMGAVFVILGAICAVVVSIKRSRRPAVAAKTSSLSSADEQATAGGNVDSDAAVAADNELLMSALQAAVPFALPQILRLIIRNLPVLVAIIAAGFVLTRPGEKDDSAGPDESIVPAE